MTLSELREQLGRIAAHPLTECDVGSVQLTAHGVQFTMDKSELEGLLEDAKESEEQLEKDVSRLEAEVTAKEEENEKLQENLDLAKQADNAETLLEYKQAAEDAEKSERQWREISEHNCRVCGEAVTEMKALRSRKGVPAELFKRHREVVDYLASAKDEKGKELYQVLHGRPFAPEVEEDLIGA